MDQARINPPPPIGPCGSDAAAAQSLVHSHSNHLLQYIDRHLPSQLQRLIDPADVLQDTFFVAFQHLSDFTPRDANSSLRWLLTIARNRMVFLLRMHKAAKRDGRRVTGDELRTGSTESLLQDLATYYRTPSRSAAAHELMTALERCIEHLPLDQREAVRLRYLVGMSLKEVAARMSRSEGAVQMLALRGLTEVRRELKSASLFLW
jgi:RNA polymerase sigma-70 factor, ECF subfamily